MNHPLPKNRPLSGNAMPRFGGIASMMRLPITTTPQGLETIRGGYGLNMVGCDLVEVPPPYDTSGNTALLGANLLFEMLCVLPGVLRRY